jgi:hypothetical protein
MSSQPFTIRVRIHENEVELSGCQADVLKALDSLPEIVDKVTVAFSNIQPTTVKTESQQQQSQIPSENVGATYPTITVTPETPCPEAIIKLLSTDWARREPRRLNEILEAMKINAIHYPLGTVKGRLTDLTKKGVLRRIKNNGSYGYILIKQ